MRLSHPLFSKGFDDRFSRFLIHASGSLRWNLLMLACLALFLLRTFGSLGTSQESLGPVDLVLPVSVVGLLLSWFAAMAHSAMSGKYRTVAVLFLFWPLAYIYNLSISAKKRAPRRPQ